MKASLNWLRSLLTGLTSSASDVADTLTRVGLEVEGIEIFGSGLDKVLVASVVTSEPHPSKSSLHLVTMDLGPLGRQMVVCGAPNVPPPGGLVCFAPQGACLNGQVLGARVIGGVESRGMLCSEADLGIGTDNSGLLLLPAGFAQPGTALTVALPDFTDTIFEINVTPNRPDALGHVGLARDLGAALSLPFEIPRPAAPVAMLSEPIEKFASIRVLDDQRCPYYGASVVTGVTIAPSPLSVRLRLASLGVRPISNIVDITNLLMLEFGQPLHAFDLDLLAGSRIEVRRARAGEKMITLDSVERTLDADDLLICDGARAVALAGVMGGENTEIRATTRNVLFEAAYFDSRGVRRTSRRHGIHTESSHRFERGVDPNCSRAILGHTISLATNLAGGRAPSGFLHSRKEPFSPSSVRLRVGQIERLLGTPASSSCACSMLNSLGFVTSPMPQATDSEFSVSVPTWRPDVTREADLIEEIARLQGLAAIPTVLPPIVPQEKRLTHEFDHSVRQAAMQLGLSETVTYSFVSESVLQSIGAPAPTVRLINPLTEDRNVMRTSMLPGLLDVVARARRHGVPSARIFGIGSIFVDRNPLDPRLPDERPVFAALLNGTDTPYLSRPREYDLFDAKAIALEMIERVLHRTDVAVDQFAQAGRPKYLHPRAAAFAKLDEKVAARFGLLHPGVAGQFDLAGPIAVVEIDLQTLRSIGVAVPKYQPVPRVPAATRDVALVVHEGVSSGKVAQLIQSEAGELCESVELFDVFRGGNIPEDHRSLAYHVVYRDPKAVTDPDNAQTLTDQQVDQRHNAVVRAANAAFGAQLR